MTRIQRIPALSVMFPHLHILYCQNWCWLIYNLIGDYHSWGKFCVVRAACAPIHVSLELFTTQSRLWMTLIKKPFGNIKGKGENTVNQHFPLFPQCFQSIKDKNYHFSDIKFVVCKFFQMGQAQNFVVW